MATMFPEPSPTLPHFRSMLVEGPCHPSAPIHLMLSHIKQNPSGKAMLLTPSRQDFATALIKFSDEWLNMHGGDGQTCAGSSRVDVLYPPSRAHLALLLSMLHVYDGSFHHPKTTLPAAPSLLVLHEVSALFSADDSETTLSSYLSLISHALAVTSALSTQSNCDIALTVFDSGLSKLKLPILQPVSPTTGDDTSQRFSRRREPVSLFVEKYFEWVGTMEELAKNSDQYSTQSEDPAAASGHMRMILRRTATQNSYATWRWVVGTRVAGPGAGGRYFQFS